MPALRHTSIYRNNSSSGTTTSYLRKTLQHGAENMAPTHFLPPYIGVHLRPEIAAYHHTYYCHVILSQSSINRRFDYTFHFLLQGGVGGRGGYTAKTTYIVNSEGA